MTKILRGVMSLRVAAVCLVACSTSAWAQDGVANRRDVNGNLVRDTGAYSVRGVNQGPVNNGPIRNTPVPSPTTNSGAAKATGR
jgi:hypothetical protein